MYLKPEPEYEVFVREQSSNSNSPAGQIDEYLHNQNVKLSLGGNWFESENLEGMFPVEEADLSAGTNGKGPSRTGWMKCAKVRTPKAFEEVKRALLRMEEDLPLDLRNDWGVWNEYEQARMKKLPFEMFGLVSSDVNTGPYCN
jgi:hypothetical protein